MYIFQPDRVLLKEQVQKNSHFIRGRTLDVGAGTYDRYGGSFSGATNYVRMDVSPGNGIDVVGTAYEIPFEDNTFDSIVSTQVYEHLARPVDAAAEFYRVLKSGGYALITAPQTSELHEEPHDFFRYTNFGLIALFENAGFKIVSIEQRGGYYAMLAQIKIRHLIDHHRLYKRAILGRVLGKLIWIYGHGMLWLDQRDKSQINAKHAVGWCVVVQKP